MNEFDELRSALFDLKMAVMHAVRPFLEPMAYFLALMWLGFGIWQVIALLL